MNIISNKNNDRLEIALEGRLDTTTAPELDSFLNASYDDIKSLAIDCEKLAYISSAGLRVILKAQKVMNSQGSMKLTGVNDSIMEVFDITGFLDILTIE
jgi:anti-sigma B factor antagonist